MQVPPPLPLPPEQKRQSKVLVWLVVTCVCLSGVGVLVLSLAGVEHKEVKVAEHSSAEQKTAESAKAAAWDADFKAGFAAGKSQGEEWASLGQNMPLPQGLDLISTGQAVHVKNGTDPYTWKQGFKAGYGAGFVEAKRTWRPATANNDKY